MENSSNEKFEKKERQLENLENLVENHTRTERHLEQYSHIGDKDNKDNAREKQDIREKQILELENKILGLDSNEIPEVQLETLKERRVIKNNLGFEPRLFLFHKAIYMFF